MNRRVEEQMSRLVDGELDAQERAALERRLQAHPEDRAVLEQWRGFGDRLREPVPAPTAEAMWNDVQRAIRRLPAAADAPSPGWRWGWSAAIVAAVLVAVLGLSVVRLVTPASAPARAVEWVEAELPDASTLVYEDEESGVVVIWLMTAESGTAAPRGT